ncbi:MAG: SIR2 family protein [Minicystis sp.]
MALLTLSEARPKLREAHRDRRLIPFLGSGFSAPLRLPLWGELMGWMGQELDFDPGLFEMHGTPRELAGFYASERKGLADFVATMQKRFHAPEVEARRKDSIQHQALARRDFRRIYTTNFEHHIEEALRDAGKKAAVLLDLDDYMRPTAADTCQVIKFHGDLDEPETVVLTENQFFERFQLEAPSDQLLRADLLGNVFLFLGYSFSDINIRYIWHRMFRLREAAGARPEHRSYLATFGAGAVQTKLLEDWHIDIIELDATDKSKSVAALLDALDGGAP